MPRLPRLPDRIRRIPLEAVIWIAGLAALALTDPTADGWLDLCVFRWIGLDACPGCGLGHAVAFLLRGDFAASVQAHPLGLPAVLILGGRIVRLIASSLPLPQPDPTFHVEDHPLPARTAG